MYCLNMLAIALELAREDPAYEDVASKFFEHFVYIAQAMNNRGGHGMSLWDEDRRLLLRRAAPARRPARFHEGALDGGPDSALRRGSSGAGSVDALPGFKRRMQWFLDNFPTCRDHIEMHRNRAHGVRRQLTIVNRRTADAHPAATC